MSDLNLIPIEIQMKIEARNRQKKIVLLSVIILLFMAFIISVPVCLTILRQKQNTLLINEINKLSYVNEETKKIDDQRRYLQERQKIFDEISKQDRKWTVILEDITTAMPQDIFVNNIDLSNDSINMQCTSPSHIAIASFVAGLENNDTFSNVYISEIVPSGDNQNYNFNISFTLNDTQNKEK